MAKLSDMVAKALKQDVSAVTANPVSTVVSHGDTMVSKGFATAEQDRFAEVAYIAKTLNKGSLNAAAIKELQTRAKAVGLTSDIVTALPDGFTGTLLRDIQDALVVARLFPMGVVRGGTAHDLIATYGIKAYLTGEGVDATQSNDNYITFVKTTKKIMAEVAKSYEMIDDALINLADEVRMELVRAIAEGIEIAVINGDISGTMDAGTPVGSPVRTCNGIRKAALAKGVVNFGGAALTEADMFKYIISMQLAGNLYLNDTEVARGNVALVVDNYTYAKFRLYDSFRTIDKAGSMATLFGGTVSTVFNIPVISTTLIPAVDATGVVSATPANNTKSTCVMLNVNSFKLFSNGSVIAENDRNITNQTLKWTSSLRFGFSSVYDSTESAPNTIVAAFKNAIAGINIAR